MSTESMVTQAALEIAREAHAQQAERDDAHHTARGFRAGSYDKGGTMPVALLAATLALRHRTAAQPEREAVLEEAAKACEEQQRIFASSEYAAGQPMSSFGERFAAGRCAEAIRALKTTPAPAVSRDEIVAAVQQIAAGAALGSKMFAERVEQRKGRLTWHAVNVLQDNLAACEGSARAILSRLQGEGE